MQERLREIREHIHSHPEISNREEKTAEYIAGVLEEAGLEVTRGIAGHGLTGLLKGGKPGPVVAARADMDALALPVPENTGLAYASEVTTEVGGEKVHVMHACGHDVHMTSVLGAALELAPRAAELPGTIKFVFQPAEEGPPPGEDGGAGMMVREGVLKDPDVQAIFALHVWPDLDVGQVGWNPGGCFASAERLRIKIIGEQTHAAYPWRGTDPIVIASQVVLALQAVHGRQIDARVPSVISISMIRGGSTWNILPGEVLLSGTVRTYSEEMRQEIRERIHRTLEGVTAAAGASFEVLEYKRIAPVTMNHPELTPKAVESLRRTVGEANVHQVVPTMGAEDFGYFAGEIPGFYFRLGARTPGKESFPPLHSPEFAPDQGACEVGVKTMVQLVTDYLERGA